MSAGSQRNAQLAIHLIDAGVIDPAHYQAERPVSHFIARALKARLQAALPERHPACNVHAHLELRYDATEDDHLLVAVMIESGVFIDGRALSKRLEPHPLMVTASLLQHIEQILCVLPAFGPGSAQDILTESYWMGDESGEALYAEAAEDLAYSRGVPVEHLTRQEIVAFADEHYWSPNRVEAYLPATLRHPCPITLEELRELAGGGGAQPRLIEVPQDLWWLALPDALQAARTSGAQLRAHPLMHDPCQMIEEYHPPIAVLLGYPTSDALDLVTDVFHEYEQTAWQVADFGPSLIARLDTQSRAQLHAFADLMTILETHLNHELRVLHLLLEVASDQCPRHPWG